MSGASSAKMKPIPPTKDSVLLRTYFGDDASWQRLCEVVQAPVGEFRAYVSPVSEREYEDISVHDVVEVASGTDRSFVFVADRTAQLDPEHLILVVPCRRPG
jgi:hypothetical protein